MTAWLTVYRERADVWRWLYTRAEPGEEPFVLPCSTAFPTASLAREAAVTAYAGLPVQVTDGEPPHDPLVVRLLRHRVVRLALLGAGVAGAVWWVRGTSSGRVHRTVLD
ncbi:MAG TPA: hypothetical protein VHO27_06915 [Angustibacter sp.]|nr:hypothetical protein [Angustibacter sp.]